ncbi:peroxidase [Sarracenia purpurea var. burkii]
MSSKKLNCTSVAFFWVLCRCVVELQAQLQVGFYDNSCDMAEFIVKEEVRKGFNSDKGLAAGLVRMHFHDCFVRSEGLGYDVPAGRRDGRVSLASEASANLPPPTLNINQLTQAFANKGLTQEEMVTLSGAHTIGRSHCTSFSTRLYNFNGTSRQDPSLDPSYASQLRQQCPQGSTNSNLVVPMNPSSPTIMDVGYYEDVLANRGLFTSDQTLLTNPVTVNQVNQNARNTDLWSNKFADAMVKMGQIGVLTGNVGEIRSNCRKIN